MKKTGICPKCNSDNIVRFDGNRMGYANNLMVGYTTFSAVDVNRYVCCNCGFTEEWIDVEDLPAVEGSDKAIRENRIKRKTR